MVPIRVLPKWGTGIIKCNLKLRTRLGCTHSENKQWDFLKWKSSFCKVRYEEWYIKYPKHLSDAPQELQLPSSCTFVHTHRGQLCEDSSHIFGMVAPLYLYVAWIRTCENLSRFAAFVESKRWEPCDAGFQLRASKSMCACVLHCFQLFVTAHFHLLIKTCFFLQIRTKRFLY